MLSSLLTTDRIFPGMNDADFNTILLTLTQSLASECLSDPDGFYKDVQAREADASTRIAPGIFLPHARSPHVTKLGLAIATVNHSLQTEDEARADLVFLIAIPYGEIRSYLQVVAELSRMLHQSSRVTAIHNAADPHEILELFQ